MTEKFGRNVMITFAHYVLVHCPCNSHVLFYLVEPNPELFMYTKSRLRNSYLSSTCFSTKTHPEVVEFDAAGT